MNLRKALLPGCLVLSLAGAIRVSQAQEPLPAAKIRHLSLACKDGVLKASWLVEGAFSAAVEEKLASAQPVRFVHHVRVARRRPLFFGGKVLLERIIETTARFDNLTRQYALGRVVDGVAIESQTTESEEEMR